MKQGCLTVLVMEIHRIVKHFPSGKEKTLAQRIVQRTCSGMLNLRLNVGQENLNCSSSHRSNSIYIFNLSGIQNSMLYQC